MAQSKITLIGMERFLNPDHSVFDELILPSGINKETFIGTTLMRCQEFELLYPDPEFMTAAVNVWGRKHYWTFDRWVKVLNEEYDPLYNKDYHEAWTDTHEGEYSKEGTESASGNSKQTNDLTMTNNLKTENDTTVTHAEKAYNDQYMVDTSKDTTDGEIKDTGTVKNTGTVSNQFGNTGSNDESGEDSYTKQHTYHGWGNIGITSAQELVQKELSIAEWNMYEHMADLFASEFCIMIY